MKGPDTMGNLTIMNETAVDATVISNIFIDKYMKDANDAQLKVYLYIFRMVQSHTAFSVSDIADQFNHTEREVLRALKYWEKLKLMSLSFDSSKTLLFNETQNIFSFIIKIIVVFVIHC